MIPSPTSPAECEFSSTSSQARKLGAAKPPRLPRELIRAMVPAAAPEVFRVLGLPVTFLIDRKGIIRGRFQGGTSLDVMEGAVKRHLRKP